MSAFTFGAAFWLAFVLHVLGVELYLKMTPAEGERLRQVSYERQLERGLTPVGRAGMTVDRWGDAERWVPKGKAEGGGSESEGERTLGGGVRGE